MRSARSDTIDYIGTMRNWVVVNAFRPTLSSLSSTSTARLRGCASPHIQDSQARVQIQRTDNNTWVERIRLSSDGMLIFFVGRAREDIIVRVRESLRLFMFRLQLESCFDKLISNGFDQIAPASAYLFFDTSTFYSKTRHKFILFSKKVCLRHYVDIVIRSLYVETTEKEEKFPYYTYKTIFLEHNEGKV